MSSLVDQFARSLPPEDARLLPALRDFVDWRARQDGRAIDPDLNDDVEIRSYLVQLRHHAGAGDVEHVRAAIASLRAFYAWARDEGLIAKSPFELFNFGRPLLSRDQIRRREQAFHADPNQREIGRLQALNQLSDQLNRSVELGTALLAALDTLVQALRLKTAWAFLRHDAPPLPHTAGPPPPHGFTLASSCGLPSGLAQGDCAPLTRAPLCHCQELLLAGRLVRAVNVVECTRLRATQREQGDTGGLMFHATVPLISRGQALGMINVATEDWELLSAADLHFLSVAGAQVAASIERTCHYEAAERQRARLSRELEMARAVQESLLPSSLPEFPGFRLAADWRSAGHVAGDFYDVFALTEGQWGLVVADVSGKGAPAALYMAMARSPIRAEADRHSGPSDVLAAVNGRLRSQAVGPLFVTVFYGVLDASSRSLTYSIAGHEPPVLRRASGEITLLSEGGLMLGPFEDARLADRGVALAPGDALVVHTDGLTEAANRDGELFGSERLANSVARAGRTARDILTALVNDVAAFAGDAPAADDLTLLVLESRAEGD